LASLDPRAVAQRVSNLLDLSIEAQEVGNSQRLDVRVDGLDRPHGFFIQCWSGLSFVYANLELDSLAGGLLRVLSSAGAQEWEEFLSTLASLAKVGYRIEVRLDGSTMRAAPKSEVSSFEMSAKSIEWQGDVNLAVADLGAALAAAFMSMLPLDNPDLDPAGSPNDWKIEGSRSRMLRNHYERSRSNRALAILAHGTACMVCGFDFERNYGPFGKGYVEIHHLTPVHLMETPRVVNPLDELVPLCSNCHSMVHRVDPPIPPDTLREILDANRG